MIDIFKKLGLKELIRVEVIRHFYHYGNYEITLEEVNKLGNFIEIEYKLSDDDVNVDTIKAEIRSTVESLGIATGEEQQAGKPELLLRATQGQDEIDT